MLILICTVSLGGVATAYLWSAPRTYTSSGSVFVEGGSEGSEVASSLGVQGMPASNADYVFSILNGKSLRLDVIKELKLMEDKDFWRTRSGKQATPSRDSAVYRLEKMMQLSNKLGLVSVSCSTYSPDLSYKLVKAYLDLVKARLLADNSFTEDTYSERLTRSRRRLNLSEDDLQRYQSENDVAVPQEMILEKEFSTYVGLVSALASAEVELKGLDSRMAGPSTIEMQLEMQSQRIGLQSRVDELRERVGVVERRMRSLPKSGTDYLRLFRDLKFREEAFKAVAVRYELLQLESTSTPLKVVDQPFLPEQPDPSRRMIKAAVAVLAGMIFGLLLATLKEQL